MATITFTPKAAPTTTPSSGNGNILGLPTNAQFFLWGISALTLIALADPFPNIAIGFTWLLVIGVLLINSSAYIGLLNSALGGK